MGLGGGIGFGGGGGGGLLPASNLSDVLSAATSRTNLGLGTAAVQNVGAFAQVANNLSDVTAATARTNLGVAGALISAASFTTQSPLSIPSVFSASYRFYEILIWAKGSAQLDLIMQLAASGTPEGGTAYYTMGKRINISNTEVNLGASGTASWTVARVNSTGGLLRFTIANPYHAENKQLINDTVGDDDSTVYGFTAKGLMVSSNLKDGIVLTPSTGTITGAYSVRGIY